MGGLDLDKILIKKAPAVQDRTYTGKIQVDDSNQQLEDLLISREAYRAKQFNQSEERKDDCLFFVWDEGPGKYKKLVHEKINGLEKEFLFRETIGYNEVNDKDGKVKQVFKTLDLNKDDKVDPLEWSYYSTGGKFCKNETNELTRQEYRDAVKNIDEFTNDNDSEYATWYTRGLYYVLNASQYLTEKLPEVIPESANDYNKMLNAVKMKRSIEGNRAEYNFFSGYKICTDFSENTVPNNASAVFHELTHNIQTWKSRNNSTNMNSIEEEVQSYYMQALFEKRTGDESFSSRDSFSKKYYDDFTSLTKKRLTRDEVARECFLKNDYLMNRYSKNEYYPYAQYGEKARERMENDIKNKKADLMKIGDLDFSQPEKIK